MVDFQVPCPLPENLHPVADAGGPYVAEVGSAIVVDGPASFDPEGMPLTYDWYFGDGETATGATAQHTYEAEGESHTAVRRRRAPGRWVR